MTKDRSYTSRHTKAIGAPNMRTAWGEYNFVFSSNVHDWYRSRTGNRRRYYEKEKANKAAAA